MTPIKYLNGLGLVASGARNIRNGTRYSKYFRPPSRNDKYLSYAGTTTDTIEFMRDIIKNTLDDTKQIAPVLRGNNLRRTLSNIFSFIFNHIQYKPDDPENEELRRPVRAWADRVTGVDCDCYSILIGSILSNLDIPFALRMVKINGKPFYQHVYVVVPKNGQQSGLRHHGSYYTIDPVLDTFNEEHPFTGKYDLFMQPIKYLNGVPSASLNGAQGDSISPSVYYSPEAAREQRDNVIFFDGLDYYQREDRIQGLNGLGFLRKIWGGIKTAGKIIKKIGKKAIKKVVFKKDGTKRGLFRALSKKKRPVQQLTKLTPRGLPSTTVQSPTRITPIGTPSGQAANSASPTEMISIAKDMDKSLGVDSVLNIARAIAPDNKLINELVDAKSKANKGLSTQEARMLAKDAARAEKADMMESMYKLNQPKQAGFSGINMQTMMMLVAGIGLTAVVMNRPKSA